MANLLSALISLFIPIFLSILVFAIVNSKNTTKNEYKMIQKATGDTKIVKRGFSFTYLFFGCLVPLFRGHVSGFFISLAISIFTIGFGHIVLSFSYNKMYINHLVKNGYTSIDNTN